MVELQTRPTLKYIAVNLVAQDAFDAIAQLVTGLKADPADAAAHLQAVCAREQQGSTCIGYQTALPHARIAAGARWELGFGYFPAGVPWGEARELAYLVFLNLVPGNAPAAYLGFVKKLALTLRDAPLRDQLLAATEVRAARNWLCTHLELKVQAPGTENVI